MLQGKGGGVVMLTLALALAWAVVALGQAWGGGWIAAVIGAERAQTDAVLVDTLFTLVIFAPLIAIALVGGKIEGRSAVTPGDRPGAMLGLGLGVGFTGLTAAMLYAGLAGALVTRPAMPVGVGLLLWGFCLIAVQTVAEEIYFRGWLQPALVTRWGIVAGVGVGALAFAALHIAGGARAPVSLVNLFLGGLMFGLFALHGKGIAAAAGVHLAWNASEQLIYGLDPNPGTGGYGSYIDKDLVGAALWGGSSDGLNGSIGMTFVLLAILAPLIILTWKRTALSPPPKVALTS